MNLIKKSLLTSSTLPPGTVKGPHHHHEHAADGSCCGHSHDHGHDEDEDDVTDPRGGRCC